MKYSEGQTEISTENFRAYREVQELVSMIERRIIDQLTDNVLDPSLAFGPLSGTGGGCGVAMFRHEG